MADSIGVVQCSTSKVYLYSLQAVYRLVDQIFSLGGETLLPLVKVGLGSIGQSRVKVATAYINHLGLCPLSSMLTNVTDVYPDVTDVNH